MDANHLGTWARARPFRPFVLHLTTGEAIAVDRPEDLGFAADTPVLVVFGGAEGITMIDHAAMAAITPRDPDRGPGPVPTASAP